MKNSKTYSPDPELNAFCEDLLQSVKEMKKGKVGRETRIPIDICAIRAKTGLTQEEFSKLLGCSVRTYQAWEQGVRNPSGAAYTLLRIADMHPTYLAALVP